MKGTEEREVRREEGGKRRGKSREGTQNVWDCVRIEQKMLRRFRGADQRRDYHAEEDVRTSVTLAQGS